MTQLDERDDVPKSVTELMDDLIADRSARTKLAQLRDVFADVDRALARGVSTRAVCAALATTGLHLSERMLRRYVTQLRTQQAVSQPAPQLPQPQDPPPPQPARTPTSTRPATPGSANPVVARDVAPAQTASSKSDISVATAMPAKPDISTAADTPPPAQDSPPPPRPGRSIREIRNSEVDFAAAEKWYREQRKAGKP